MDQAGTSNLVEGFGVPSRDECLYAACYCEENVWQLCKAIKEKDETKLASFRVIFISNESKAIPLWHQRAGKGEEGIVMWDYHVILLRLPDDECTEPLVYDLDTTLPFPCPFAAYFDGAIRFDDGFNSCYKRKYRIIPASEYLLRFSSDRSHMRNNDGSWMKQPPPWPCIQNEQHENAIVDFWSMDDKDEANFVNSFSDVMGTSELFERFTS